MRAIAALAAALLLGAQAAPDPHLPTPTYDTVPPTLPASITNSVLIFSKTNGWRHIEHLPRSNRVVADLAAAQGRASYRTENAAVFNPAQLRRFAVVVLNSSSGDLFTPAQRRAFADWITAGGRVVALHAAGDDSQRAWTFYRDRMIGTRFTGHPNGADQFQPATVVVTRPDHPTMRGVALPWRPVDEWYSFDRVPSGPGTTVLATIEERSYRPGPLAMGRTHPIAWTRNVGKGAVFYSAIGHTPESYDDPNYRRILANALTWAARRQGE